MICGNKTSLGNSVLSAMSNSEKEVLSEIQIEQLKKEGRLLMELWNE